jgi:2-amino-4-hydroxy-6-hydroxymethyldihydropteridine diphosphokinase
VATLAYVSGGSNLHAHTHVVSAARSLKKSYPGARFSHCFRNAAVGFTGADFINFVAELPVTGKPAALKAELERIERWCGRPAQAPRWEPRAMDLDILLFGDVVQDVHGLVLPRPDLLNWAFMLGPLAELAPALVHPVLQDSIGDLWQRFDRVAHPMTIEPLDLNAV